MTSKIGIVTVLYKSETVLIDFFASLNIQTYKNFVLYVIDNKSPDNSLALSKELASKSSFETVIISNEENYGVAKGNNIGISKALNDSCDLILLSNNDVVFEANTIDLLMKGMDEVHADMVVPKIYFFDSNIIWLAGGGFNKYNGWNYHTGYLDEDTGQYNERKEIGYAPTCFMLIRKEVFDSIGLMDENYFVYWDDTDFIYRATNKNMLLYYIPDSKVYHKESTSTGKQSHFSVYFFNRNFIYFALKNYKSFYLFYVIFSNLIFHTFKRFFKMNIIQWQLVYKAYIQGLFLYMRYSKSQ